MTIVALLLLAAACFAEDPDINMPMPQLVLHHGYPAENHFVVTDDGYILTVHRIPRGKGQREGPRPAVLLQHGLLGSSADWVMAGPENSLAYILADSGYDVWLGNARGNTYSRDHRSLSPSSAAFWDFSWHEMGTQDLPAVVDHILNVTASTQLIYIGHSMGTTMFFVLMSQRPEYKAKVRVMVALAPVALLCHVRSPIRLLAPFSEDIQFVARFLGANEFLPQSKVLRFLAHFGCDWTSVEEAVCENAIFSLVGFDAEQFNTSLLPVILGHTPAGTSTKTLVHFAQLIHAGRFQQFDCGSPAKNVRCYGTQQPPEYDLSKVTVPLKLHYSDNDWLSVPTDVKSLAKALRSSALELSRVTLRAFNHLDFLWGTSARELVYNPVLKQLKAHGMELTKKMGLPRSSRG